jgi:hypothetical protein
LGWREWLCDDDAVRNPIRGPIPIVGGNIDDWERGVFLSYARGDFPAGQATHELYVRDWRTRMFGAAHEERQSFLAGRHNVGSKTSLGQHLLEIGLLGKRQSNRRPVKSAQAF